VVGRERTATVGLVLAAAALAVAWPLSAYSINPFALPALVGLALATAIVLQRPEWGLGLVLALSPLINSTLPSVDPSASSLAREPFEVLVPVLAIGVLAYSLLVVRQYAPSGTHVRLLSAGVALFAASGLISSAQAIEPSASLHRVLLIVTGAIVFFSVRQTCNEPRKLLVVLGGALAGLLIASVQGIADQILGVFSTQGFVSGTEVVGRVQGSFGHPNMFGGFLALLMPVGAVVAFNKNFSASLRWLASIAVMLAVPALVFSYARGAMVGLFVGCAVWLAVLKPRVALLVGIVIVTAAVTLAPATLKNRFESDSSSDVALRSDIWNGAIEIYSDHPVFGVGLNNFQVAYGRLPANSATSSQRRLLHDEQLLVPPHAQNIYLEAMAEQGIVGLLSLLAVLLGGVLTTYRAARSPQPVTRALGYGVGIGLVGVMVHGFLEVIVYSETILPLLALLGVVAALVDKDRDGESVPASRERLDPGAVSPVAA
jgi:putative inorganic carbon (HCO3(-)) transporter